MNWHAITRILLLLLASDSTLASSNHPGTPMSQVDSYELPYLRSNSQQNDVIFAEAISILDSLKSSPSCNKVAATRLVASCQSVNGKDAADQEAYETLDRVRSMYAARLAICELDGAGASIPSSCLPVTVSPPPTSKFRFFFTSQAQSPDTGVDVVSNEVLGQCLKVLESRPQWWISYSNNRQNAMVICQAARIEIEREELLDLHRSIVKTSSKLSEGLQDTLRTTAMETAQHNAFLERVRSMQNDIFNDLEKSASVTQNTLDKLRQELQVAMDTIPTWVNSIMEHIRGEFGGLNNDIHDTSKSVQALQQSLNEMQEKTISQSQEVLRMHEEDAMAYKDVASVLHDSLQSLVDTDVVRLSQRMMTFHASLEWINARLLVVLEQENRMEERLQTMETSMEQSYNRAHELQKAQQLQLEALTAQSREQEEIQFKAQVSQALLDKVAIAATSLHSIIDEATVKFKRTPGLSSGGPSAWTICALILILLGAHNARMAVALAFIIFGHLIATFCFHLF